MSSNHEQKLKGLQQKLTNLILKDRVSSLTTARQLLYEIKDFKSKEENYFELIEQLRKIIPGTEERLFTRYMELVLKFDMTEANENVFQNKLEDALNKEENISGWLNPLMENDTKFELLPIKEQIGILKKYEDATKDVTSLKRVFQDLKNEWEDIKMELNDNINDGIQKAQDLIEELKRCNK